ncbi:ABC transporter permease [Micromonospora profundi]|uniref:ABC transporter permease n=1 Tax=Micromonospora TaxID=1873 RepID=UPI0006AF8712|nr:ABC transporter permease [Micromonospora sp. NRRL B-16802]KOX07738.1 hypothetical protein ADK66_18870 [Micromonospora sp. NRRL B-16802]
MSVSAPEAAVERSTGLSVLRRHGSTIALAALWLALVLATAAKSSAFLSHQTVIAVAFNMAFVGILVVGVSVVMLSGAEFDLSVGVTAVAAALIAAQLLTDGMSFAVVLVAVLVFGTLIGVLNATLIVKVKIHPIVATLGTMFLVSGTTRLFIEFVPIPRSSFLRQQISGNVFGVPRVFWIMLVLLVITGFVVDRTRLGRHIVAIGGNQQAALVRGLRPGRIQAGALVFCGLIAGVAGLALASQGDIVQSTLTPGTEFRVISILLLGGMALTGGRGNFVGVFAALLLLSTLPTAIVTWGVSSSWQPVVEGLVLAVALAVNSVRSAR